MKFEMDIDAAVKLMNKKGTTVDDICKFLFSKVEDFQNSREDFYMEQLKEKHENSPRKMNKDDIDEIADDITIKIEKDTKKFIPEYVSKGIDNVLDAMNQKKFRTKKGSTNLLVLLQTLKENYEES